MGGRSSSSTPVQPSISVQTNMQAQTHTPLQTHTPVNTKMNNSTPSLNSTPSMGTYTHVCAKLEQPVSWPRPVYDADAGWQPVPGADPGLFCVITETRVEKAREKAGEARPHKSGMWDRIRDESCLCLFYISMTWKKQKSNVKKKRRRRREI